MKSRTLIASVPFSLRRKDPYMSKNNNVATSQALTIVGFIIFVAIAIIVVVNGAMYGTAEKKTSDTTQVVSKTEVKQVTEKATIPYQSNTIEDPSLEYGKTEIRIKGVSGEDTYTYNVTYVNGKKVSRELVSKERTRQPVDEVIAKGTKVVITWHCIDVTSYNRNAYDDNKCTSSAGEVRYTSDSQARALDPTYSPGKAGAYYYNNK